MLAFVLNIHVGSFFHSNLSVGSSGVLTVRLAVAYFLFSLSLSPFFSVRDRALRACVDAQTSYPVNVTGSYINYLLSYHLSHIDAYI